VSVPRLFVAISLAVLGLALIFFLVPAITFWRSNLLYAMLLALAGLGIVRLTFGKTLAAEMFKRRVLVLGAGPRAARLGRMAARPGSGFRIAGYVSMNDGPVVVDGAVNRSAIANLPDHIVALKADEVVLALEERRNALPLNDLLRVKTTGVHVNDLSSFFERETGRVDLDSLNPSWLIFSDGFSSGRRLSSMGKRLFDILVSALILLITAPLIGITALASSWRAQALPSSGSAASAFTAKPFEILKLRSMRQDAEVGGVAVWAQKGRSARHAVGAIIRKLRIDELPQAWSVLKGEMSFVGPRPERPQFVADLEQRLPYYAERHMVKPASPAGRRSTTLMAPRSTMRARSSNTTSITPRTTRPSSTSSSC
jgi:lipopolysaccharide/colanic/teichoic acid biosynthesis glycosyltransferase